MFSISSHVLSENRGFRFIGRYTMVLSVLGFATSNKNMVRFRFFLAKPFQDSKGLWQIHIHLINESPTSCTSLSNHKVGCRGKTCQKDEKSSTSTCKRLATRSNNMKFNGEMPGSSYGSNFWLCAGKHAFQVKWVKGLWNLGVAWPGKPEFSDVLVYL